jgi:hypothetical protein
MAYSPVLSAGFFYGSLSGAAILLFLLAAIEVTGIPCSFDRHL